MLSITPSKEAATPLSTPGSDVVSRKRSDIDFDAFSDAKRRKTEKGKCIVLLRNLKKNHVEICELNKMLYSQIVHCMKVHNSYFIFRWKRFETLFNESM